MVSSTSRLEDGVWGSRAMGGGTQSGEIERTYQLQETQETPTNVSIWILVGF